MSAVLIMENDNSTYACLVSGAERELGAFITAVTELYGPEHAQISAEDWLEILESNDGVPDLTARDLRLTTITAAARLANRVIGNSSRRRLALGSRLQADATTAQD
jgi:hypothetical protein